MLDKYDIEKIKNGRFYSESQGVFVEIEDHVFKFNGQEINLADVKLLDLKTQDILYNIIRESDTKYRTDKETDYKGAVLLGMNNEGRKEWLQPPKWDCGWYWGFGYLQTPRSHRHFSGLVGYQEYYDHEKGCFRKGEYIHNIYDSPELVETTFTRNEGWKLSELFKQFYLLKEMAEFTHKERPGCHITESPVDHNAGTEGTVHHMKEWHHHINKVMIPKITAEIIRMLTPSSGGV